MAEFFLALFIFLGVMAVTALIFGGWIIVSVFRGIASLLGMSTAPRVPRGGGQQAMGANYGPGAGQQQQYLTPLGYTRCNVAGCRHLNPQGARYCRHCGHAFPPAQHVAVRRAAMF